MINEFNNKSPRLGTNSESAKTKGSNKAKPLMVKPKPSCVSLKKEIEKITIITARIRFRSSTIVFNVTYKQYPNTFSPNNMSTVAIIERRLFSPFCSGIFIPNKYSPSVS
ncbi:hypothetical protein ES708_09516 [subsurface metagenome]